MPERSTEPRQPLTDAEVARLRKLVGYDPNTTAEEHRLAAVESARYESAKRRRYLLSRPE